jgi:hypothetical protein
MSKKSSPRVVDVAQDVVLSVSKQEVCQPARDGQTGEWKYSVP